MCNPRRVEVTATRELAEAWEHEIRRLTTLSDTAVGEARVREQLDDGIGAPTLAALGELLAGADGWDRIDGAFRHALDGGYVAYHPDTQELEIVAQLSAVVVVEGTAEATAHGQVEETVEAVGRGVYYDDEWGGITEADAQRAAERDAQDNLDAAGRARIEAQIADAEREHDEPLSAAAQAQAEAALVSAMAAERATLIADARERLAAVGIQGHTIFYQALAGAFRDAIRAYADAHQAEGFSCVERDGVLDIEFEMQA